jgi:hypothetical protein
MDPLESQSAGKPAHETTFTRQNQSNPTIHHKRLATVYDAVAGINEPFIHIPTSQLTSTTGRVTTLGFLTALSTTTPAAPEDVLFRRVNAPPRYEEADPYFPSILPDPTSIPSSEMLGALHAYVSDFYDGSLRKDETRADWRSMDETALVALGILMEEMAADKLGATGDLVFTEPGDSTNHRQEATHRRRIKRRRLNGVAGMES